MGFVLTEDTSLLRTADHYEYDCHVSSELSLVPFCCAVWDCKDHREFVDFHQFVYLFFGGKEARDSPWKMSIELILDDQIMFEFIIGWWSFNHDSIADDDDDDDDDYDLIDPDSRCLSSSYWLMNLHESFHMLKVFSFITPKDPCITYICLHSPSKSTIHVAKYTIFPWILWVHTWKTTMEQLVKTTGEPMSRCGKTLGDSNLLSSWSDTKSTWCCKHFSQGCQKLRISSQKLGERVYDTSI